MKVIAFVAIYLAAVLFIVRFVAVGTREEKVHEKSDCP